MLRLMPAGVRGRLVLVVLIAVIPSLGVILWTASTQRERAAVKAQDDALWTARAVAAEQQRVLEQARQILALLAQVADIREGRVDECEALLRDVLMQSDAHANIGVIAADGFITCSAVPVQRPVSLADRTYFRRAMATRSFAVGDYQVGRITGKPTINCGYPILDRSGQPTAVAFAAIDLDWLAKRATSSATGDQSLLVLDRHGTVLVQRPEAQHVGKSIADTAMGRAILLRQTGVARVEDLDGVERLVAFTPLEAGGEGAAAFVAVGMLPQLAYAEANRILSRNLVALGLTALLALLAAWLGGHLFVVRHLQRLVRVSRRFGGGDLNARTGMREVPGEVGQLARAFDDMAVSLDKLTTTLEHQARHDELTGLANRHELRRHLVRALSGGEGGAAGRVALLLLDLDHFREINDTLGHPNGDALLVQVSRRINDVVHALVPEASLVARLGGDEFAVILTTPAAVDAADNVARRIWEAVEEPFELEAITLRLEASIGMVFSPEHGTDPDLLLQRADVAMYDAKRTGRGRSTYRPEDDENSPQRLALMGQLRRALGSEQLFLLYQPKVELRTGAVAGAEALVRWQHPTRGMLEPELFLGPAEGTAQIRPLSLWVLEAALKQVRAWEDDGLTCCIAVNLSARNLHDAQLPADIARLLESFRVRPSLLELEITESAIMVDPGRALDVLGQLRELGVKLSVDDFGTGHCSLGYLSRLPVDTLKIDASFVKGMTSSRRDAVIVRSTINLGHDLGLLVVAEGVEDDETWQRLAEQGCDIAQGYFVSRPITGVEIPRWAQRRAAPGTTAASHAGGG